MVEKYNCGSRVGWKLGAVLAVTAVWSVFVVSQAVEPLDSYAVFFRDLLRGFADLPSLSGFIRAMLNHLVVLVYATVFVLAVVKGGEVIARIFRFEGLSGLERTCVSGALGWTTLGTVFFGLALTGLFYASLLFTFCGAFLAAGIFNRLWAGKPIARIDGFGRPGKRAVLLLILVAAPVLVALPILLVPPVYIDFLQYHMGAPERFLKLHRFVVDGAVMGFNLVLTAELLNAIGVVLGQDPLAAFISLVPFVAALAASAKWIASLRNEEAAALAVALSLSLGGVIWIMGTGKNDLAAAGMCLAALVAQGRGRNIMAPLFWGMACVVKMNCLPFAGLAWIWYEGGRIAEKRGKWRPDPLWFGLILLPILPWLIKSFILKGDPLWPLLSKYIPWALWGENSGGVLLMALGKLEYGPELGNPWHSLRSGYPVVSCGLILLFFFRKSLPGGLRSVGALSVVAFALFMHLIWAQPRYMLPLGLLWCYITALILDSVMKRVPRWMSRTMLAGIMAGAWISAINSLGSLSSVLNSSVIRYLSGRTDLAGYFSEKLTTTWETRKGLGKLPGIGSVLFANMDTGYGWPGKSVVEERLGRKQTWVLTHESATAARMYIRLKQKNVRHMVFNCVTEFHVVKWGTVSMLFPWDDRQLTLLREFMKRYTEIVMRPLHCDAANGGYYVYGIVPERAHSETLVYYLPGIQEVIWRMHQPDLKGGDAKAARRNAEVFLKRYPDVGIFRMISARLSFALGDFERAYWEYSPLIKDGMIGEVSHLQYMVAALETGRNEEVLKIADEGARIFTDRRDAIEDARFIAMMRLALKYVREPSRRGEALALAEEAVERYPSRPAAHVGMAVVLYESGRTGEAKAVLRRAVERWPEDKDVREYAARYM